MKNPSKLPILTKSFNSKLLQIVKQSGILKTVIYKYIASSIFKKKHIWTSTIEFNFISDFLHWFSKFNPILIKYYKKKSWLTGIANKWLFQNNLYCLYLFVLMLYKAMIKFLEKCYFEGILNIFPIVCPLVNWNFLRDKCNHKYVKWCDKTH